MPARIPDQQRKRAIDLWRKGQRREQIASTLGISAVSVFNIIRAESAAIPDLQELRELGLSLKNAGVSLEEAKEGADLLQRINELEIPLDILSEAVSFYENQAQSPDDLISLGKRIDELTKQYDRSPDEIITEAEKWGKRRESLKGTIADEENRIRELQTQITCFEILLALQARLTKHGITPEVMDNFITQNQELQKLDFTPGIAEVFATELAKYHLDKETAYKILASDISGFKTLQEAINDHGTEADRLEEENSRRREENRVLKKQHETQLIQIDDAKLAYEKEEKTQERTLALLGSNIEAAEENLKKITSETADIESVKATLTLDLEQIEETVERNEYVKTMTVLMAKSPILLDWKTVQKAYVPFFNGFIKHLQENKHVLLYSTLMSNALKIREILTEWARYDS